MSQPEDVLMNLEEAAKYLKISVWTAQYMARKGKLPGHKLPGSSHWRFYKSELDAVVRSGKIEPEAGQ